MSLLLLSIGVGIIFTTNELVHTTRNFKSNASRFKQTNYEKNAPQAKFLTKCDAGKVYQTKCAAGQNF